MVGGRVGRGPPGFDADETSDVSQRLASGASWDQFVKGLRGPHCLAPAWVDERVPRGPMDHRARLLTTGPLEPLVRATS